MLSTGGVCRMKAVIVAEEVCVAERLTEKLIERFENKVSFGVVSLQGDLIGKIKEKSPELLLTVDLSGFNRVTLTDNIAYNLFDCKQLHIICSEDLQNEKVLETPLSIAMFFACSNAEQCDKLRECYPHIPWLTCMKDWSTKEEICSNENVAAIVEMLEIVMTECFNYWKNNLIHATY